MSQNSTTYPCQEWALPTEHDPTVSHAVSQTPRLLLAEDSHYNILETPPQHSGSKVTPGSPHLQQPPKSFFCNALCPEEHNTCTGSPQDSRHRQIHARVMDPVIRTSGSKMQAWDQQGNCSLAAARSQYTSCLPISPSEVALLGGYLPKS